MIRKNEIVVLGFLNIYPSTNKGLLYSTELNVTSLWRATDNLEKLKLITKNTTKGRGSPVIFKITKLGIKTYRLSQEIGVTPNET